MRHGIIGVKEIDLVPGHPDLRMLVQNLVQRCRPAFGGSADDEIGHLHPLNAPLSCLGALRPRTGPRRRGSACRPGVRLGRDLSTARQKGHVLCVFVELLLDLFARRPHQPRGPVRVLQQVA